MKIENAMRHWSDYLDFLSVVEGYREVALISLGKKFVGTRKDGKPILKLVPRQYAQIKTYLEKNHPKYTTVKLKDHGVFIAKKNRVAEVKIFIKQHDGKRWLHKDDKALGKLLGFPECCMEKFIRPRPYIPFVACSEGCAKEWTTRYLKLKRKYKVKTLQ
jgi:hypothetical protein